MFKRTWTDKLHPQTFVRGDVLFARTGTYWNTVLFTPAEEPDVIEADTIPVVDGYEDLTGQVYLRIPGERAIDPVTGKRADYVVPGTRPLSWAGRLFRRVPVSAEHPRGEDETAVMGPYPISQAWLDGYLGIVVPTYFRTHPDNPVGLQIRFTGGPVEIPVAQQTKILKAWERA